MLDFTLSIYKQVLLQSADSIVIATEVNYINQRKVYYSQRDNTWLGYIFDFCVVFGVYHYTYS